MAFAAGRKVKDSMRGLITLITTALNDRVLQMAAALTYYTVLSLFPALFIIVALLGLIGLSPETLSELLNRIAEHTGSQWAVDIVSGVLDSILASRGTSLYLGAGILVSLWSASGYVYAFVWASDAIYRPPVQRSYFRTLPLRVGLALVLIVLFTAAVAMVAIVGPLGDRIAAALHIEGSAVFAWAQAATPLLAVAGILMLTLLYKFTPSRHQPGMLRLAAGALVTIVLWAIVSVVFSYYLANFASYNKVYGTLGAAVGFLVWVWMLNAAALFGVEVNRALELRRERRTAAANGEPPVEEAAGATADDATEGREAVIVAAAESTDAATGHR
jgi:membrane protein